MAAKKVLIVEDNADWRELLAMVIRKMGYQVLLAGNGEEGVEKASLTQPHLILMDLGLPKLSGDQATSHLKSNPATKEIPIVIQTAFGASPGAQRALDCGAAEILHKPISITEIQNVVTKYLTLAGEVQVDANSRSPESIQRTLAGE